LAGSCLKIFAKEISDFEIAPITKSRKGNRPADFYWLYEESSYISYFINESGFKNNLN